MDFILRNIHTILLFSFLACLIVSIFYSLLADSEEDNHNYGQAIKNQRASSWYGVLSFLFFVGFVGMVLRFW